MWRGSRSAGYILFETVTAMAVLSVSMLAINSAVRDSILMRGQARDYTQARFLLEAKMGELEIVPEFVEKEGRGRFEAPFDRFSYQWRISRIEVPKPRLPEDLGLGRREALERIFNGYMPRLEVAIFWSRGGYTMSASGATLLQPERLWTPPPPE